MKMILVTGRSLNQGRYINIGKDKEEYRAMVRTVYMNGQDLSQLGLVPGMHVRVCSEWGEGLFRCEQDDLPSGIAFILYGPPTTALMGGNTDGTGMPLQKGYEVDIEAAGASDTGTSLA